MSLIDFRNVNTLWASVIVETWQRFGVTTAIICPGSRSTPLTVAFAQHLEIETIPILDERSAAFFALGRAKKTGMPTILVCTSGTAGANFYPAVIEATQSRIPLIILTADRPPELRNCRAEQTIDRVKLYGSYPNWQTELALPEASLGMLQYLRQNVVQAWERSLFPIPGVVDLNVPFREPLAPTVQPEIQRLKTEFPPEDFFESVSCSLPLNRAVFSIPWQEWYSSPTGIIIAGLAQPANPEAYTLAIARLAQLLSFPVLAEALSPVRNYASLNPYLISTYDCLLRNDKLARELLPKVVIQVGELPTSKQLRSWLSQTNAQRWVIEPSNENFDPLHGKTIHLHTSILEVERNIQADLAPREPTSYCQKWCEAETKVREAIDSTMGELDDLSEGKVAWLLSACLPAQTSVFIANSMSVRYAEFFWQPNNNRLIPYFSRGANGIDGTLSTAMGIAHGGLPAVLLTGDLALLHDTNGFLNRSKFQGHLTIVLINNNGGGIFEMLPIAEFKSVFEDYFATPQAIDFAKLAATYDIEHKQINHWADLEELVTCLPTTGIRILELTCDRQADAWWLKHNFARLSQDISFEGD